MGAVMDLDVIRANVWRVIQLRTFLRCTIHTHTHTYTRRHGNVSRCRHSLEQTHLHTNRKTVK